MWKFMARLFMVLGVVFAIAAALFTWAYFIAYTKANMIGIFVVQVLVRFLIAVVFWFMGDFMLKVNNEEKTLEHILEKWEKNTSK